MTSPQEAPDAGDSPSRPLEDYRVHAAQVPPDGTLRSEDGWLDMEVRWLVTRESVGSTQTVIGRTVLQPGSRHDLHRHPHAEEWEYVVSGSAIKYIGTGSVALETGDVVFVPANVDHGLANASDAEPVVTIWGYSGAATLQEAGYVLAEAHVGGGGE